MSQKEPTRTLWMGDLEPYMDDFFILHAFETMGEPAEQVKMINSKYTGFPAGYCFVDFADAEGALRAQLRLNGKTIPNSEPPKRFKLNSNNVKDQPRKEFSLFVGDLSEDVDDFSLYKAFEKRYPSSLNAKVVLDSRGNPKGYGFVRFSEEADQQAALNEMMDFKGIGKRPIRVSLATPKKTSDTAPGPPGPWSHFNMPPRNPSSSGNSGPPGNFNYDQYYQAYQQFYSNYYNSASQSPPSQAPAPPSSTQIKETPSHLEDPELNVDVYEYNKEYMDRSEEVFEALEDSRWTSVDHWNSPQPTAAR